MFELRFAKMPEAPPQPITNSTPKLKMRGVSSESSDGSSSEGSGSASSGESDSESERANQLSYLQKQVSLCPRWLAVVGPDQHMKLMSKASLAEHCDVHRLFHIRMVESYIVRL